MTSTSSQAEGPGGCEIETLAQMAESFIEIVGLPNDSILVDQM